MRICFDVHGARLGNDGGSRTLIRCAEVLSALGHKVFFWPGPSKYTWHAADIAVVSGNEPPKCDVALATGIDSCKSVMALPCKHAAYVRGLGFWKAGQATLLKTLPTLDHVFCNSEWQLRWLRRHKLKATLQYPGLDTCWFKDEQLARAGVAALMCRAPTTKRSGDAEAVAKLLGHRIRYLNRDIRRPTPEALNVWYNGFKVWLATTEMEGLHNPPMEAGLAGCALVCTDHERAGMSDFVTDGETALVYPARGVKTAAKHVARLLEDDELRRRLNHNLSIRLWTKIGPREAQMATFAARLERL